MHSKEEAKQKVAQLVEKFKLIPEKERLNFNEEQKIIEDSLRK